MPAASRGKTRPRTAAASTSCWEDASSRVRRRPTASRRLRGSGRWPSMAARCHDPSGLAARLPSSTRAETISTVYDGFPPPSACSRAASVWRSPGPSASIEPSMVSTCAGSSAGKVMRRTLASERSFALTGAPSSSSDRAVTTASSRATGRPSTSVSVARTDGSSAPRSSTKSSTARSSATADSTSATASARAPGSPRAAGRSANRCRNSGTTAATSASACRPAPPVPGTEASGATSCRSTSEPAAEGARRGCARRITAPLAATACSSRKSSHKRVLPIPGSPSTSTITRPPACTSRHAVRSSPNASSRPTRSGVNSAAEPIRHTSEGGDEGRGSRSPRSTNAAVGSVSRSARSRAVAAAWRARASAGRPAAASASMR